jgi:hypothetical protein
MWNTGSPVEPDSMVRRYALPLLSILRDLETRRKFDR